MHTTFKLVRSFARVALLATTVSLICLPFAVGALGQAAEVSQTASASSKATAVIPQQVRYAGMMPNRGGDTVQAVFSIYASAEGGEALWTETQVVPVSPDGSYTVMLGSASESGLPQSVFAAGQARWLAVSLDRAERGPRTPLASVAYAMKAGDAETVGGVAVANLATKEDLAKLSQTVVQAQPVQPQVQIQPETAPSGTGTTDYVPLWTGSATLGNSNLYQATSGFMGIGTTTPGGPLELDTNATGGANATMMLRQTNAASGNYYADIGLYNSNGLIGNLSALGAGYPTGQLFGPNDVVFLGGQQKSTTNLIFVTNTSGALKFGTGGYGTGNERMRVGATGGLSLGNSYVGTDPGAGNFILSGKLGVGTTTPAAALEVNGTAKFDGLVTFASGQTFPGGGGSGTITGITTTSPLTGSGTSGSVALGFNTTALETTEETTYDKRYALLSGGNVFASYLQASQTGGVGQSALSGFGGKGSTGVAGVSDTGVGVSGISTSGHGVVGDANTAAAGSDGVLGFTYASLSAAYSAEAPVATAGVWGDSATPPANNLFPVAVFGTSDAGYGGVFVNQSATYPALAVANETGTGAQIHSEGSGDGLDVGATSGYGVSATTEGGGDGVYGFNANPAENQAGVLGVAASASQTGQSISLYSGVWGDTGTNSNTLGAGNYAVGILGSADDSTAGEFLNNSSDFATLFVNNYGAGGLGTAVTGSPRLFNTLMASSANGTCGIGGGSMSCTGPIKSLASAGGSRTVETYAMQSPENWMEDFGSGSMVNGHASVSIDAAFAATVSGDASYHVFITPKADSKGLYVTAETASGFEVRESGGGTSSLSFDYRIVAKRAGYEGRRMVDVTETFNRETSRAKMVAAAHVKPAVQVVKRSPLMDALKAPHRTIVPSPMPKRIVPQAMTAPAKPVASK